MSSCGQCHQVRRQKRGESADRDAVRWGGLGCREQCQELVRDYRSAMAHDFPWEAEDAQESSGASRRPFRELRQRAVRHLAGPDAVEVALRDAKERFLRDLALGEAVFAGSAGRQRELRALVVQLAVQRQKLRLWAFAQKRQERPDAREVHQDAAERLVLRAQQWQKQGAGLREQCLAPRQLEQKSWAQWRFRERR